MQDSEYLSDLTDLRRKAIARLLEKVEDNTATSADYATIAKILKDNNMVADKVPEENPAASVTPRDLPAVKAENVTPLQLVNGPKKP